MIPSNQRLRIKRGSKKRQLQRPSDHNERARFDMATAIIQGDSPICHQCGKQFPKRRRGFSKFCSSTCKTLSHRDRRIAKRKDAGRRVIGDPALCATCGCAIVYTGGHGRYCDGCRQLARKGTFARWRENHPEKQRAIQRACDDRKLVVLSPASSGESGLEKRGRRDGKIRSMPSTIG